MLITHMGHGEGLFACVYARACMCVHTIDARKNHGRISRKHEDAGQRTRNPHATQFTLAPTNSRRHLSLPSHPTPKKGNPLTPTTGFLTSYALHNQQTRPGARMIDFLSYAHNNNKKITITADSHSALYIPATTPAAPLQHPATLPRPHYSIPATTPAPLPAPPPEGSLTTACTDAVSDSGISARLFLVVPHILRAYENLHATSPPTTA